MKRSNISSQVRPETVTQICSFLFEVLVLISFGSSRFTSSSSLLCSKVVYNKYLLTHTQKKKNVCTRNHSCTTVFLHLEHTAKSERALTLYNTNSIRYCLLKNHSRATVFLHLEHTALLASKYAVTHTCFCRKA